jgi:hypothetical protein
MTALRLCIRAAASLALTAGLMTAIQPPASALIIRSAPRSSSSGWSVVPSPNAPKWDVLDGVTATSSSDAWAVGAAQAAPYGNAKATALAEQWDGHTWQVVPVPAGTYKMTNELTGVTSLTPDDAWAVGLSIDTSAPSRPQVGLAEHWNGKNWSVSTLATVADDPELQGVTAISPNDIWAVGERENALPGGASYLTLAEHYNGHSWTAVPAPNPGSAQNNLAAVAAAGPDDVWAVGHQTESNYAGSTLIEHWNGKTWQVVDSPNVAGASTIYLSSVAVWSADDVWAAGSWSGSTTSGILLVHWNGKEWGLVADPAIGGLNSLTAIVATGPQQVWGVGGYTSTESGEWNGTSWVQVPTPNPGNADNLLAGITAIPGTSHLFAVGYKESYTHPSGTLVLVH